MSDEKYPEKSDKCPIDWQKMLDESKDIYFLKREVKRLMRENDALEFRAQLAYAFGYGDSQGGQEFDGTFDITDIYIEQDDDDAWTAARGDQPDLDNPDEQ